MTRFLTERARTFEPERMADRSISLRVVGLPLLIKRAAENPRLVEHRPPTAKVLINPEQHCGDVHVA